MDADRVVELLRQMYAQQLDTDERGQREVAAWHWLDELREATGDRLIEDGS